MNDDKFESLTPQSETLFYRGPQPVATRDGNPAVVLMKSKNRLIGAYFSAADEWVPCSWDLQGYVLNPQTIRALDIAPDLSKLNPPAVA